MNSCATSHVSNDAISSFDAGGVAKRFRHAAIFGALDEFREGGNFLVSDPDTEERAKVDVKPSELKR